MANELKDLYNLAEMAPSDLNSMVPIPEVADWIRESTFDSAFYSDEELNIIVYWCHAFGIRSGYSFRNINSYVGFACNDNITCSERHATELYYMQFTFKGTVIKGFIPMNAVEPSLWNKISGGRPHTDIPEVTEASRPVFKEMVEDIKIPEYSYDVDYTENTSRFSGALWYEAIQNKVITLAGLGGIGSYTAYLLGRMNPKSMFIYDNDSVEFVNLSGQFYSTNDIGNLKSSATIEKLKKYCNYYNVFEMGLFDDSSEASDIMICGFDSMKSRKLFFKKWLEHVNSKPEEEKKHCLFIDGRLSAEDLQVYCVVGDNTESIEAYVKSLFDDEQADATVCSYKQTSFMANMIGSIIVNVFVNFVSNELFDAPIRELPMLVEYDALTMQFKLNGNQFKTE